jgi:hypothetical protein
MASEARYLTQSENYSAYAQRWLANILGVNAWDRRLSWAMAARFRIASSTKWRIWRAR